MKKVYFIFLPEAIKKDFVHHLGVAYIQAYLKKRGIESHQFIPKERMSIEECAERIIDLDPPIGGFTIYDYNYYLVKLISKCIKKKRKDLPILAGGPSATFSDILILEDNPFIDICVRGEGEETVYELISDYFENGFFKNLDEVRGITFRRNRNIVRNQDRPLIRDPERREAELDILPSPFLEGILNGDEETGILTSRGCTFKCTYCNFTAMSRNRIRYHSVGRVINELRVINKSLMMKDSKDKVVTIYDDAFTLNVQRAKEICKRVIEEKFCFNLTCETRVDRLDDELLELMAKAGFKRLSFGLESAVPEVLRNVKKVGDARSSDFKEEKEFIEKVERYVKKTKELNMKPTVSIILGLPGEKLRDGIRSVKFVEALGVDFYAHNFLQIFPGTELFETHGKYGIRIEKGQTLLPFDTYHSYDLSRVPFGKKSTVQDEIDKSISTIIGIMVNSKGKIKRLSNLYSDFLIKDFIPEKSVIEWMSKNSLILSNVLFLFGNREIKREEIFERMLRSGFPSKRFYILKLTERFNRIAPIFKKFQLVTSKVYNWNIHFSLIPFHIFKDQKNNKLYDYFKVLYLIENKDDLDFFEEFVKGILDEKNSLRKEIINFKGCFLNGCIFARECHSLNIQKIVIEKNLSLKTCLYGERVGYVGDNPLDIQEKFLEIFREEESRRRCDFCPVKEVCSRCPFLKGPLKNEYCRIRRENPNIWKVVEFLEIASRMPGLLKE